MIPELVGALGLIAAAVITGMFRRLRKENGDSHGKALDMLEDISETVHEIDEQLDEVIEWQEEHQKYHDRKARTPR